VLGCSAGTVKSAASRGMARLRELHADTEDRFARAQHREEIR
jgi:DNA-directed RNA polymerase specialized sigma24 family protein